MIKKLFRLSLVALLGFSCLTQTVPVHAVAETARSFDEANNEWFEVADSAGISVPSGTQFTVGGWFYFDSFPSSGVHLMGQWPISNPSTGWVMWVDGSANLRLQPKSGGVPVSSVTLSTATWYFLEAGYDGTNGFVAVNRGTRNTNNTFSSGDSSVDFTIGRHDDIGSGSDRAFDGRAQMLFMYKTTEATSTQLDDHYNSGSGKCYDELSDTSNMIAHWTGNESSGNLVDDHGSYTMTDQNTVTSASGHVECSATASGQTIRTSII